MRIFAIPLTPEAKARAIAEIATRHAAGLGLPEPAKAPSRPAKAPKAPKAAKAPKPAPAPKPAKAAEVPKPPKPAKPAKAAKAAKPAKRRKDAPRPRRWETLPPEQRERYNTRKRLAYAIEAAREAADPELKAARLARRRERDRERRESRGIKPREACTIEGRQRRAADPSIKLETKRASRRAYYARNRDQIRERRRERRAAKKGG